MESDYLSVEQVSARLGVNPETVKRWLRAGTLRGVLLSRRHGWRIRPADVDAYVDRHSNARLVEATAGTIQTVDELRRAILGGDDGDA